MMKKMIFALSLFGMFAACQPTEFSPNGKYKVNVLNKDNISGTLEIVGETNDYFGRVIFKGKRTRTFPIGLIYKSEDSLSFQLAGNGYLRLKKQAEVWKGNFKYFGLEFDLEAQKSGAASEELKQLIDLKPLGKGSISTAADETFPCYDSNSKTLYFTRGGRIYETREDENGVWTKESELPIHEDSNISAPYLFNDGKFMLFTSNKPLPNSDKKKKNLWITGKSTSENWAKPYALPSPVNIDSLGEYHAAIAANFNVFFVSYNRQGGFGRSDIYKGIPTTEGYIVENLGEAINTKNSEADAFIHPDEKYLLVASTNREDSYGEDDIYISFQKNGTWTPLQNIGAKVNSFAYDYGAWIDADEAFFYFNSYRRGTSDIYRIPLKEIAIFQTP